MVKKVDPNTQNAEHSLVDASAKPGRKRAKKNIREKADELTVRIEKFKRGPQAPVRQIKDKKLRGQLRASELLVSDAVLSAAKAEQWLLPAEAGTLEAEGMERTYRFQQVDILKEIETVSAQKAFDLSLPTLGPYHLKYTRNGRHALLGGRQGHLAIMEWGRAHLVTELQVKETTRDIAFLHNETFFAAAQKKHVYIYDKRGLEVHCLRDHNEVHAMQFLPYHFLLATIGKPGVLVYQDTSTGQMVAEHKTKLGRCDVLQQNPWNAVLCAGHHNGVVTMWSPNSSSPLVQMLCHQGPIKAIAVDMEGYHMVTAGQDKQVKVWDVRTYKPIHNYFSAAPAVSLDISQRRLLAVGYSGHVQVWKDALNQKAVSPYMNHHLPPGAKVENVTFCPYDDVLGVGHSKGVTSLIIPGAGEPNFDSFVANPYMTVKQRREQEVHQLLDKLNPSMIQLDPDNIGLVKVDPKEVQIEKRRAAEEALAASKKAALEKNEKKTRMKGKNKASKRFRKKQMNVIDEKKHKMLVAAKEQHDQAKQKTTSIPINDDVPRALHRFYKKPKS